MRHVKAGSHEMRTLRQIADAARLVYGILVDSLYPRRCPICDEVLPWGGNLDTVDPEKLWSHDGVADQAGQHKRDTGICSDEHEKTDGVSYSNRPGKSGHSSGHEEQVGDDALQRLSVTRRLATGLVCRNCFEKLSFVTEPTCAKCGKQLLLASQELCADCKEHPKSFERGVAALNYEEHARESMIKIKYGKRREYAKFYGRLITGYLGNEIRGMNPQCIIPVPVHPERFIERGYNQAELLAGELSRCMNIPLEKSALVRVRKTAVQKNLGPKERLKNLSEAFGVMYDAGDSDEGARLLPYDRVLLADDIYTTGSTIEACTRVLKAAGVKEVYFVTICTGSDR